MSVEEVDLAIRKATAMYLFVVTKNLEKCTLALIAYICKQS